MAGEERSPDEIREILAQLVELQEVDREIVQVRKQLASLPPKLRALDERLAEEERAVEKLSAGGTDTRSQRRKLEREIRDLEHEIKEHRKRQMEVKTNKELAAVMREIEALEQKVDQLETRVLEMIEQEEAHERSVAEARENLERLRSQAEQEKKRIHEQIRSKKEKIERLSAERNHRRSKLPPDVLSLYDRISERHPGDVVVPVVRNHCGGCHISLVSQKMVEIRQMKNFVRCEGCLRLFSGQIQE